MNEGIGPLELKVFIEDTKRHKYLMTDLVRQECGTNPSRIMEMIEIMTVEPSFFSLLSRYMKRERLEDVAFYKSASISRAIFSNMQRDDYRPNKATVLKSAIALNLDFVDTSALLEKAGYAFIWTDATDLTLIYCIMNRQYELLEIDALLVGVGERTLFSVE